MSHFLLSVIHALVRGLDRLERLILTVLVTGMVILAAVQILLRNIWHTGFNWAEPLLGMALLWLTMLGALAATGQSRHISIDLAAAFLPKRGQAILRRLTGLFAVVVCAMLAWAAGRYVGFQSEMETNILLGWPLWKYYLVVPVVLWLMAWRFLVHSLLPAAWLNSEDTPAESAGQGRGGA
ncbi:MAG TPA: TRAP transporter small permease [Kiritimatiellia bacterium]|nr:TRAP transporter small permease [Kiritimatiellia bacterium]HOR73942.1 TRAP transporter small permease [Kiritimatiellia bacterium]HPK68951.1 TRAP transporter small permease [Kiritimatiellia bacterium]